ncbi:MAG: phosphatidate cytidylyltransferase [Paraprevotella sp.]|nr:phosphatidate cytidylyltransferase [Paraprevotella sp.]
MKNFIIRALTGALFVAVLIGSILWNMSSFSLLFAIITGMCIGEFCKLVNSKEDVKVNTFICSISGVFLFLAFSAFCSNITPSGIFIPYLLSIIYLLVSELYLKSEHALNNWAYTMMSQLYIALPFATLNILAFQPETTSSLGIVYTPILPLSIFIFLWTNDTGAYCIGCLFGKHRLFPRISPKKSWEGSIGGATVAIAASQIIGTFDTSLHRWEWLGLSLVVVVFGTWGDLVESLIKRQLQIKDSGNILPGHGGMLDRFDSSLLAIPASVIYIYTLTLI